jgi:formamidopyrimidine-DNA glycosylase
MMPELPEVETVRRGLLPMMEGVRIEAADIRRPDLRWPFPDRFGARLEGAVVTALRRRSKYILADLSTGETLIIHLGMSGRMLIQAPDGTMTKGEFHHQLPTPAKHDHVVLDMANGARITFNDARRFGAMDLVATETADQHWLLNKLGPEPLGNAFHESYLIGRLAGRNTPIKSALLDQRIVAGLGNIYVCEALFRTKISPKRKAGNIAPARVAALVPIIREVLEDAIRAGGSSLRDYRQADGELGYFQHTFQVYDREGEPCLTPDCGGSVTRIVQSGRSSFYCPQCQR